MNATDIEAAGMNPESFANDLTQLSSREQLSALMDGALPADQTRFLLRRLQHDAPLAECWERWRLTGEVMRGLAPAQRLPADFALRVGAALHGDVATPAPPQASRRQTPAWLRWGGGAAMAASLAVVALMARQPVAETPSAALQLASSPAPAIGTSAPLAAAARASVDAGTPAQAIAAATVVAAAASRPARSRGVGETRTPVRAQAAPVHNDAMQAQVADTGGMLGTGSRIPQPDIVTRPWPRSVLPQYASSGLAVGFGEHPRGAAGYNPFQAQAGIGNLPPVADGIAGGDNRETVPAPPAAEPQP